MKSRITEFPDGSKIFQSEINETPADIAMALGFEVDALTTLNRKNYPQLSNETILQKGVLLEIPSSNALSLNLILDRDDLPPAVDELSGTSMAVHVHGSGENVGRRTEGQLIAKDRNRPYVVHCGGKELKLSEFCQLGGNKKNRPRESIILTSTNECLFEYEARMLARRASAVLLPSSSSTAVNGDLQRKLKKVPGSDKSFDVPEKGYLVTIDSHQFHDKIGVVKNRSIDGWYEIGILKSDRNLLGIGLKKLLFDDSILLRRHNFKTTSQSQQMKDVHNWASRMQSALISVLNVCTVCPSAFSAAVDRLLDSITLLRTESMKQGFKMAYDGGWLHVLSCTTNPCAWEEVCDCLGILKKDKISCSLALTECVILRESIQILTSPLLALEIAPKLKLSPDDVTEIGSKDCKDSMQVDEEAPQSIEDRAESNEMRAEAAKLLLESLENDEQQLQDQLKEINEQILVASRRRRAFIRRQDNSIGISSDISNVMDARSQHFVNTKSRLEMDISILAHALQFLDSSTCVLHIKQGNKILKSIEKEMDNCRERNELLAALTLSLESSKVKTSKRMLQFSAELQEGLEETLSKQRASLTTAQRLQRKIEEMLPVVVLAELPESDMVNSEAHTQKAQSNATDGDALITPKGSKSIISAASKPPVPLLQEARANTVVLGLPAPADEYQVGWEKSCQHSRGTAWLQPPTTKDSSYAVPGLTPGTDYRFRYRMLVDGSWSEWSKAVIYGTKGLNANGDEVSGSSDLELTNPILFWPDGADTAELNSTNSKTDAVSKAWSEIMDEIFTRLNSSNRALISRLQQSLEEFDSRDSNAVNDMEVSAAEADIAEVAESEVEARGGSPGHDAGVGAEAQNSPHSSSAPVQRARTKADLRLGGLRLVSSPRDLILPRPASPTEREMKRARLSPSASGGQPAYRQDGAYLLAEGSNADRQRGGDDRASARPEHDAKERQLLSLKLAARLNRLQHAGADSDARFRSPSPPAHPHPMAASDLPGSPAACAMSDQEAGPGAADDGGVIQGAHLPKGASETGKRDDNATGAAEAGNVGGIEAVRSAEEPSGGSVRQNADKATAEHQAPEPALDAPAKGHAAGSSSSSVRSSQPSAQVRHKLAAEARPAAASLDQRSKPADGSRPRPADEVARTADTAASTGIPEGSGSNRRPASASKKAGSDAAGRADAAEEHARGGAPATSSRLREDSGDTGGGRSRGAGRAEAHPSSRTPGRAHAGGSGSSAHAGSDAADGTEASGCGAGHLEGGTTTGRGRGEGGKARTESAVAAPAVVAVEVGMRVAVKWEARWAPETDGWVEGVVAEVSNGYAQNPNGKGRIRKGWCIVEYEGRERHVHLLNAEHHVAVMGDCICAWKQA